MVLWRIPNTYLVTLIYLDKSTFMFTGIIETVGKIISIKEDGTNKDFVIESKITNEFKIDQSVAHNGCCLTVVALDDNKHTVTAIKETLDKTNLGQWKVGDIVNIERCMPAHGRFDGHIVQGHVDQTATCISIKEENGSWEFRFNFVSDGENVLVSKGSVTVNGTSLTVVNPTDTAFSVCIIPYTYEETVFKHLKIGDKINLEFDIIGKYVSKMMATKA